MRAAIVLSIASVLGSCWPGDARSQTAAASAAELRQQGAAKSPVRVADLAPAQASERAPGNPLWALPLGKLTATRDRPLFSPSRRPPPPVEVHAAPPPPPPPPAPPPEPEKLVLSLVGTVVGAEGEGFALFLNPAGPVAPLRIKTGVSYKGWVLRAVRQREVEFSKEQLVTVLKLPVREPNAAPAAPPARLAGEGAAPVAAAAVPPAGPPPGAPPNGVGNPAPPPAHQTIAKPPPDAAPVAERKSGFHRPGSVDGEEPIPVGDIVIQQPAILLAPAAPPPVNPFARPR